MSTREAAPLTARLLTRKRAAAPSGDAPSSSAQPQPAKDAPRVKNVHPAPPTVHAVDLTPPDFLRATAHRLPPPAHKRWNRTP
jgi:hypothetical protein